MEAEHEMELKELRQQLKRVHTKDPKQEEYVRNNDKTKETQTNICLLNAFFLLKKKTYICHGHFIFSYNIIPFLRFYFPLSPSFFSLVLVFVFFWLRLLPFWRNNFIADASDAARIQPELTPLFQLLRVLKQRIITIITYPFIVTS